MSFIFRKKVFKVKVNEERILAMEKNEEFLKAIALVENVSDLKNVFSLFELGFSEEETYQIYSLINSEKSDELVETELDDVSGGGVVKWAINFLAYLAGYAYEKYGKGRKKK